MKTPLAVERDYKPDTERQLQALMLLLTSAEHCNSDAPNSGKEPGTSAQPTKPTKTNNTKHEQ